MSRRNKKSEKHNTSKSGAAAAAAEEEELIIKKQWVVTTWPIEQVGLYKSVVKGLLRQKCTSKNRHYYCYEDWETLMNTNRYVFEDLCRDFHNSYHFKENPESIKDKEFMKFSLRGREFSMSLEDFTRCLTIYTPKQMDEKDFFIDYIWSGAKVSKMNDINHFDPNLVWKELSSSKSSSYGDGKVSRIDMDDVKDRLIHLYLSLNIFHRSEDTDKVTLSDMWYLKQIRSGTTVCIPYCVAYYLQHFAVSSVGGGGQRRTICGGRYVTLIAHHLGVIDKKDRGPVRESPYTRGNPMLMLRSRQYLDAHIISWSANQDESFTVFQEGLEEKGPTDDIISAGLEDEDDDGGGIYESLMSKLEEIQWHSEEALRSDHNLSEEQLTQLYNKCQLQLEIWDAAKLEMKNKKRRT